MTLLSNDNDYDEDFKIMNASIKGNLKDIFLSNQTHITGNCQSLEDLAKDLFSDNAVSELIHLPN